MKNNIRVQRAIKNITQEELARLAGVSRQTINAVEAGKYVPSALLAFKIAKIFGVTADEVFMLEEHE